MLYVRTGGKQGAELVDAAEVRRRYGVPPELVPDFIALRGDPSDGIPGREGHRREDGGRAAPAARLARGCPRPCRPRDQEERARGALTQADELRRFKEIATLQDVDVELPADTPTDYDKPQQRHGSAVWSGSRNDSNSSRR